MVRHTFFSVIAMLGLLLSSCDDGPAPGAPTVAGPQGSEVIPGGTTTIAFSVIAPGGIASLAVTADQGTATVTNEAELLGQTSGAAEISYTAPASEGSVNVTLTVTDNNSKSGSGVVAVGVTLDAFPSVSLSGEIDGDRTLYADTIYILENRVVVVDGTTVTIEAGTVIKGQAGTGANSTALIVAQGGTLNANGTSSSPIIMTSFADEIKPGQIESPNLDPTLNGLWGGLIILGKAPISADAVPSQIEGIPPSDSNGQYGGDVADDDSGTIRYVSIRHGGTNIGEGNEINGLTLGGVGSATTIEYIEIVGNQDDGIECFGGTVDISNILVWNQGDDAYDMDQAYSGTIDNFIYIGGPDSDHAMELDGPEGSLVDGFTLRNGSLKGWNSGGTGGGEYIDFRDGVLASIENSFFFNFSDNSDVEIDDDVSNMNWKASPATLDVTNLEFDVSHLTGGNITIDDIFQDKSTAGDAFTTRAPSATIVTTATVGADKTKFANWTWADEAGELADF